MKSSFFDTVKAHTAPPQKNKNTDQPRTYWPKEMGFYVVDNPQEGDRQYKPYVLGVPNFKLEIKNLEFKDFPVSNVMTLVGTLFDRPFAVPVYTYSPVALYVGTETPIFPHRHAIATGPKGKLYDINVPVLTDTDIEYPTEYDILVKADPKDTKGVVSATKVTEDTWRVTYRVKREIVAYFPVAYGEVEEIEDEEGVVKRSFTPKRTIITAKVYATAKEKLTEIGKAKNKYDVESSFEYLFGEALAEGAVGESFVFFYHPGLSTDKGKQLVATPVTPALKKASSRIKEQAAITMESLGDEAVKKMAIRELTKVNTLASKGETGTLAAKIKEALRVTEDTAKATEETTETQ